MIECKIFVIRIFAILVYRPTSEVFEDALINIFMKRKLFVIRFRKACVNRKGTYIHPDREV